MMEIFNTITYVYGFIMGFTNTFIMNLITGGALEIWMNIL